MALKIFCTCTLRVLLDRIVRWDVIGNLFQIKGEVVRIWIAVDLFQIILERKKHRLKTHYQKHYMNCSLTGLLSVAEVTESPFYLY
jgi:predicted RNA-binding protein